MFGLIPLAAWGSWFAPVAEAALETRAADVLQYLFAIGIAAILALVYRIDHRLARVELTLNDPDRGVVAELRTTRTFRHAIRNRVFSHGFRLRALEREAGLPMVDEKDEDIPELEVRQ